MQYIQDKSNKALCGPHLILNQLDYGCYLQVRLTWWCCQMSRHWFIQWCWRWGPWPCLPIRSMYMQSTGKTPAKGMTIKACSMPWITNQLEILFFSLSGRYLCSQLSWPLVAMATIIYRIYLFCWFSWSECKLEMLGSILLCLASRRKNLGENFFWTLRIA